MTEAQQRVVLTQATAATRVLNHSESGVQQQQHSYLSPTALQELGALQPHRRLVQVTAARLCKLLLCKEQQTPLLLLLTDLLQDQQHQHCQ